ncbi:MAG: hypothetical protein A2014_07435 [Spirochaetes bacterium GWF1_49_6]|nr:MAG: hypothetical protein A2014_07435 [Spirochaetes bacterium GWF1_49_6]
MKSRSTATTPTDGRSTERRQDVEAGGHHGREKHRAKTACLPLPAGGYVEAGGHHEREKNVFPSRSREIEGVILGEDSSTNEHEYARMKAPPRQQVNGKIILYISIFY